MTWSLDAGDFDTQLLVIFLKLLHLSVLLANENGVVLVLLALVV